MRSISPACLARTLIYLPTVERGKIVPKMANLTLRTIAKPDVTDLFSVRLDGT